MTYNYLINRKFRLQEKSELKYIIITYCCALCLLMSGVNATLTFLINSFLLPLLWLRIFKSVYFDASIIPMAFFFNYFGKSFGVVSIIWIYFALYLYKFLFIKQVKLRLSEFMTILVVGVLQLIFPVSGILQEGLKYIAFLICTVMLFSRHNKINNFEPIYINIMLFCSASALIPILGIAQVRTIELADGIYRYTAGGIQDPNYSSFLMLVGAIAAVSFKAGPTKWKKIVKFSSLLLCLLTILRSVSISGIFGIGILALVYASLQSGIARKVKFLFSLLIIALFLFSIITIYYPNIIDSLLWRIELLSKDFAKADYNRMGSNRLSISDNYLNSFFDQGVHRILCGLRYMPAMDLVQLNGGVTHNSYIDMLFMYGIIGTIIMLYSFIKKNIIYFRNYRNSFSKEYQFIILCSILLLYFSLTLSILPTVQWIVIYYLKRYPNA